MVESVAVLIDDTDPRIRYSSGDWMQQAWQLEHNGTDHALAKNSGSFSFSFNGTSVAVYAIVSPNDHNQFPKTTCRVDDAEYASNRPNSSANNFLNCQASGLSDNKEHTLELSIDSTAYTWRLDYIIYNAPVTSERLVGPDDLPVQVIIDDWDFSRITYDGPSGAGSWNEGGLSYEYHNSTHYTQVGGATATFKFYGSAVQVYGTLTTEDPTLAATVSTYTIDGSLSMTYESPKNQAVVPQLSFFQSQELSEGDHTLVVEVVRHGAVKYVLDFFVYSVRPSALLSEPSSGSGSATTGIGGGSTGTIDATPSPSFSAQDVPAKHVGLVVGATVGAVAALAIFLLILGLLWRRKRRRRGLDPNGNLSSRFFQRRSSSSLVEPFNSPPGIAGTATTSTASSTWPRATPNPALHLPPSTETKTGPSIPSSSSQRDTPAPSITSTAPIPPPNIQDSPSPRTPRRHVDAGVSLAGDSLDPSQIDDLPPEYGEIYSAAPRSRRLNIRKLFAL